MKKIYWIIALIGLFFIGDRLGGWVLGQLTDASQFRYSRLYNDGAAAEILLLGNSRGLIFYQPYIEEITGKNTFNFSYNGMSIDLGATLVADHLDRYPAAELLLIDVSMCDRVNNQLTSNFSCYMSNSDGLNQLIRDSIPKVANAARLSHLYRYNSEVFHRSLYYLQGNDEDWLTDREMNNLLVDGVGDADSLDFQILEQNFVMLKDLIAAAENKNVQVKLVVSPYYPAYAQRFKQFDKWLARLEAITQRKVHNYATGLNQPSFFSDYQHLNKNGARQYIDQLRRDGIFN